MDDDRIADLLTAILTRTDVLAILDALAEPRAGEVTEVNIYAMRVRLRLAAKWETELNAKADAAAR